jgi:CubicO group peptidase (beta-lactamase class C family)
MSKKYTKITFLLISTLLLSCKVGRVVVYNFAGINDYKKFPSREIQKGSTSFQFSESTTDKVPKELNIKGENYPFESYLEQNNTRAFLIIQHDSIIYENYWGKLDKNSIIPSFSMAKSVTSILIGCAIDDLLIKSVDEPITNYLPDLKDEKFKNVTIKHLLQMTSGIKFNESYLNPFGDASSIYYGTNLRKFIKNIKIENEPGLKFDYNSGNTQLLGAVLEKSLKGKTISTYLKEKIWIPLEMEFDASWSIDSKRNGMEKTFCCLNARARDFAKIGRLYLNKGKWNGKQIVSESWVEESTKIDASFGSSHYYQYQYQWWIPSSNGDFMAVGILGQYIYVNPKKDLIIVRMGKNEGKANWWELLTGLGEAY